MYLISAVLTIDVKKLEARDKDTARRNPSEASLLSVNPSIEHEKLLLKMLQRKIEKLSEICRLLVASVAGATMKCGQFQGVSQIVTQYLQNTVVCGDGEQCYTEKVATASLTTEFNMGCRSDAVCQIMASLNGRKRDLLSCAECCKTTDPTMPCNFKLCGINVSPANISSPSTPPRCLVCDSVSSPSQCLTVQRCATGQVCAAQTFVDGALVKHRLYCEDAAFCTKLSLGHQHGRRSHGERVCEACCHGNACNTKPCYELGAMMLNSSAIFG